MKADESMLLPNIHKVFVREIYGNKMCVIYLLPSAYSHADIYTSIQGWKCKVDIDDMVHCSTTKAVTLYRLCHMH